VYIPVKLKLNSLIMFGGLDIKGTPSKDAEDNQNTEAATSAPTTTTTTSSFGFMNVGADPEPPTAASPAPAAVSSFSFLNSAPTPSQDPELDTASAPVPATTNSGFSFMMQEPSSGVASEPTADEVASASNVPDPITTNTTTTSSGFDFIATPTNEGLGADSAVEETIPEEAPAVPSGSGFSFLSGDNNNNTAPNISSSSSIVSSPSPTPTRNSFSLEATTTTTSTGLPAGAGITFGTSAKRNVVKKKKMRSSKIGVNCNHNDSSTAPPLSNTTPTAVATPPLTTTPTPNTAEDKSSRDGAHEATQRAEAFMQSKAIEEAKAKVTTSPELQPTASTDDVLEAAKAAADEAIMLQQNKQQNQKGFMGTFFKGFRASPIPTTTATTHKRDSSQSSIGNSNHSNGSNAAASGMDRVVKEQQVMKHAMAERQLQQQQQSKRSYSYNSTDANNDENDMKVEVTPRVAEYKPEPIENVAGGGGATTGFSFIASNDKKKQFTPRVPPVYSYPKNVKITPGSLEPKKRNTPKEIFEDYQEFFAQSVNRAMVQIKDARSEQKMLSENRFLALAKERLATQQIEQLEQQLQDAIDEEDYEQADQLGQELDGHKREKNEVALMLQNINESLSQLESRKAQLGETVAYCFENLAVRLEELKEKEAANERKNDDEQFTQFASISKQLSAEKERIQQYSKHLEREEEHVSEERKELEDSIKEQTCEIETQKEEVGKNLEAVESEIDELRKTLDKKVKEAANLRTMKFGFEDSISKVRVKFSRQLSRVDKKEREMKVSRNEWKAEHEQHKKQKEAHDLQVQTHSDTLLSHEELKKTLESELKLSKQFSHIIPTQLRYIEKESQAEQAEIDDEEALAQLQADVVKCEGAASNAKKSLKIATEAIQKLQSEYDSILLRIPELEKEKKAAAAKRDFKAAGKASKEIKEAESRIKNIEDELNGDAKIKKASAEDVLHQLDSDLLKAREIAEEKERLSGEKRMTLLAKIIAQLVEEMEENCSDCSSEENSVKGVGARVLEGQILVLKAEGNDLGRKYGKWEELMEEIGLGGGDSSNIEERAKDDAYNLRVEEKSEGVVQDCGLTSDERLAKVKFLLNKINEAEEKVQEAAEREEYDEAAEFQDISDTLQAEMTELNVTDEELELALLSEDIPSDAQEVETKETMPEIEEEEKKETTEENDSDLNQDEVENHSGDNIEDEGENSEENVIDNEKNETIEKADSDMNQDEEESHSGDVVDEVTDLNEDEVESHSAEAVDEVADLNEDEVESHSGEAVDQGENSEEIDINNENDGDDDVVGAEEEEKKESIEESALDLNQEEVENHSGEAVDEGEKSEDNNDNEVDNELKSDGGEQTDKTEPSQQGHSVDDDAEVEDDAD
jgi:hypothetical protein